ncbi:sperm-tail PG-rich repeat protein [Daphnia sinensis]|uniref:Sperm-tail PG-rich repeat protein n=1 Tax=Daphnia sinensis TaxID=1820382 RepID=A0AAD5KFT9_9CRUS|nr:sperm-tail PG-rich repeat protein [Daphnia sinensis]
MQATSRSKTLLLASTKSTKFLAQLSKGFKKMWPNKNKDSLVFTPFALTSEESVLTTKEITILHWQKKLFGTVKGDVPVGEYDVTYTDISKKIEKQKNYLENLKKIEVEKAPFESTHTRFPHYEKESRQR